MYYLDEKGIRVYTLKVRERSTTCNAHRELTRGRKIIFSSFFYFFSLLLPYQDTHRLKIKQLLPFWMRAHQPQHRAPSTRFPEQRADEDIALPLAPHHRRCFTTENCARRFPHPVGPPRPLQPRRQVLQAARGVQEALQPSPHAATDPRVVSTRTVYPKKKALGVITVVE